jgi:hypothetical protein
MKNLRNLEFTVSFAEEESEDRMEVFETLYERLASTSLKKMAEFHVDELEVKGLTRLLESTSDMLPIIALTIGSTDIVVRRKSINVELGERKYSLGKLKDTNITKKKLNEAASALNSILLSFAGVSDIDELHVECVALISLDIKSEDSLGHLLNDTLVEAGERLGYRIDMHSADVLFTGIDDFSGIEFEVSTAPMQIPFELKEMDKIWRIKMKTVVPLSALDLYEQSRKVLEFGTQSVKMLGA